MPSVPSSPTTPSRTRPRHSSDASPSFPGSSNPSGTNGPRARRRYSRTSQTSMPCSPVTPRHQLGWRKSGSLSTGSDVLDDACRQGEGMDNLADELADAWDDDGMGEAGSSFLEGLREEPVDSPTIRDESFPGNGPGDREGVDGVRSSGSGRSKSKLDEGLYSPTLLSGNVRTSPSRRQKRGDSPSKGAELGDELDAEEAEGYWSSLDGQITAIESLTRHGLEDDVGKGEGVIPRTSSALKDLGAQAGIENGVSRLVTAYSSVAGHRIAKSREISSLTHSLLLARAFSLSDDEIEQVLAEMAQLAESLRLHHGSGPTPLQCLHMLASSTVDLAHSLQSISDLIQESRQASALVSRRLKAVRDFVAELQEEDRARDAGVHYLEGGKWDRRISDRKAASTCGEIVAGFETTCEVWRDRLFGPLHAEATPAG